MLKQYATVRKSAGFQERLAPFNLLVKRISQLYILAMQLESTVESFCSAKKHDDDSSV